MYKRFLIVGHVLRTGAHVTLYASFSNLAAQVREVGAVTVVLLSLFLTNLGRISLIKLKMTCHQFIERCLSLLFHASCFFALFILKLLELLSFLLFAHLLLLIELFCVLVL